MDHKRIYGIYKRKRIGYNVGACAYVFEEAGDYYIHTYKGHELNKRRSQRKTA